jgi:TRAP-type C4-dicarboxylate transport system permease large subunit
VAKQGKPIAALIMLVPVIVPPLVEAGVHPVHLGIIVIFNLMIGLLTPPLGLSLFVTSDIADMPPEEVIGELKIFYVLLLTILLIVTFIHEISLFFPELVR